MDREPHDPIDATLRALPAWTPPSGFARRVAIAGVDAVQAPPPFPRAWAWLRAVTVGGLAGIGAYVAAWVLELVITAVPAAVSPETAIWTWVACAFGVAALAVRRTAA